MQQIISAAKRLRQLKVQKKSIEDSAKEIGYEIAEIEQTIIDGLEANGLDNLKVTGIGTFTPMHTAYAKRLLDTKDVVTALKASGDSALVQEAVNGNSLNALTREYLREDKKLPDEWHNTIGYVIKSTVSIRTST